MERITRIAPSARLEEQINELLTGGLGEDGEHLAALGRLGARLSRLVSEAGRRGFWWGQLHRRGGGSDGGLEVRQQNTLTSAQARLDQLQVAPMTTPMRLLTACRG